MRSSKTYLQFEHYRNAIAQTQMIGDNLHGLGIVITDHAEILIGEFYQGDLHGWFVHLGQDSYAYGTVVKNRLEGYGVIKTSESTIYGTFRNDLLEGLVIIVYQTQNRVEIVEYDKGRQAIQVDQSSLAGISLSQLTNKYFGKSLITPRQYLSSKVTNLNKYGSFQTQIATNLRYYGFTHSQKNLGVIFNGQFIQSFGEFTQFSLNGLGKFYQFSSTIFDGIFQNGDWTQEGVQYKQKQTSINKQIITFRKQYHLKQMQFNNSHFVLKQYLNIADIDLKPPQKFSTVSELLKTRNRRTSSFKQQSPLKQKLRNYEKEATKYLNSKDQGSVRSYNKTIDYARQVILPPSPQNKSSYSNNNLIKKETTQEFQQHQKQQDIYDFVKKMQQQQQRKRGELQDLRTRTKTII